MNIEKEKTLGIVRCEMADELRTEGINFLGYGIVPKFVMLDTELSIEAKAVYAYFCACSGSGATAFPSRERLLDDLMLSKDTYYRHYRQLTDAGYITVTQEKGPDARFSKNIYTLVSMPEKLLSRTDETGKTAKVRVSGLKAEGYGMIPRAVMTDRRLSVKAKALYAFYAAFTGAGDGACPSQEMLHYHLGISPNSCRKYNKELLAVNYIKVVQRHVNGRLSINDVVLNDNPDAEKADVRHTICKAGEGSAKKQFTKNKDTEAPLPSLQLRKKQDTEKQDTEKQDSVNQDTISNSSHNQQTLTINSSLNQHPDTAAMRYRRKKESEEQGSAERKSSASLRILQDECIELMVSRATLPAEWIGERRHMKAAIELLTEDSRRISRAVEGMGEIYTAYRDALTDMLSSKKPFTVNGEKVSPQEVYEKLLKLTVIDPAAPDFYIEDMFEEIAASIAAAAEKREIRNLPLYMRSCILHFLETEAEIEI